jgi:uncharacterized membrane protein
MPNLDTTVAVYHDEAGANADWSALESAAQAGQLKIADAALVANQAGETVILQRQSRHGWGKGAVVGAVVGILFPPSILGAAAVGAGGGALIGRLSRALGRKDVKVLGETLDSGSMAIIVVSPAESTSAVTATLKGAELSATAPSATEEEIEELVNPWSLRGYPEERT